MIIMEKFINENDVKELLIGLDSLPWEEEVDDIVGNLPTADVSPVVHGKWIIEDDPIEKYKQRLICSVCGRIVFNVENPNKAIEYRPYCYCGARMDEE